MQNPAHIFLIGPMGAGKSTTGLALAARLAMDFVDLDARIVATAGLSIPEIFERDGEAGFRAHETQALLAIAHAAPAVVATGGGAVLAEENCSAMAATGTVVYLHVAPEEQLRRIAGDTNRPLLQNVDPTQTLARLQAEREPLYRELANLIVDTSAQTPEQLAAALALRLSQPQEPRA